MIPIFFCCVICKRIKIRNEIRCSSNQHTTTYKFNRNVSIQYFLIYNNRSLRGYHIFELYFKTLEMAEVMRNERKMKYKNREATHTHTHTLLKIESEWNAYSLQIDYIAIIGIPYRRKYHQNTFSEIFLASQRKP